MPLILTEPFESFAAWDTSGTGPNGGVSVQFGRQGKAAWIPSQNTIKWNIPSGDQTDTLTLGFAWKPDAASGHDIAYFRSDSGATAHSRIVCETDGRIKLYRASATPSTLCQSAAGALTVGAWNYLEIQVVLSDTVGQGTLKVNGVQVATTGAGADTKNGGTKTVFDQITLGHGAGSVLFIYDDLYLRNDLTFQGDPMPPGSPSAGVARMSLRQLTSNPNPEARTARTSLRLLTRPAAAPDARVAALSARVLTALNVTEARTAQASLRALVELEQPRSTVRIGHPPDADDLAARTFRGEVLP